MSLLRELRDKGLKSTTTYPGRVAYRETADHARKLKLTPHMLGVARRLAVQFPAKDQSGRDALTWITALCRKHRYEIGVAHIIRLSSVRPDNGLAELVRSCIENGWSANQLHAAVAGRCGLNRRPFAGRKPRKMEAYTDVCYQLSRVCTRFDNLCRAIAARPKRRHPTPGAVVELLQELGQVVAKLRVELAAAPRPRVKRSRTAAASPSR